MATGDMANGEGHGQKCKAEGQRDSDKPDAELGERRRNDCAAAASKDKPEGTEELRCCAFRE
jgi:hypothetical protein